MTSGQVKSHQWVQDGSVSIWRYEDNSKSFPGWHFVIDESGRASLRQLIAAFIEDAQSLHRTISVSRPSKLALKFPNNKDGYARTQVPSKMRLEYDSKNPQSWLLESRQDMLVWRMGSDYVGQLSSALDDPQEYFDRSFGAAPGVWFWGVLNDC